MERPGIALRLALAGRRDLGGHDELARKELGALFAGVEDRLAALAGQQAAAGKSAWYGSAKPRLTLVTGLADGADQLAGSVFLGASAGRERRVERILGTVLPFEPDTYIAASPVADVPRFRALLAASAYVVALPGTGAPAAPPDAETQIAAYRAQAEIILRQADILIAVLDDAAGKPGGSRETVGRALAAGMPVVRIVLGVPGVTLLRRAVDLDSPLPGRPDADWQRKLDALVDELLAPPALIGQRKNQQRAGALLTEFYDGPGYRPNFRQRLWSGFDRLFRGRAMPVAEPIGGSIGPYWQRASRLSHHYATIYRGTFLVSYSLAVVAVILAVTGLATLAVTPATVSATGYEAAAATTTAPDIAAGLHAVVPAAPADAHAAVTTDDGDHGKPHRPYSVWWLLFGIGLIEFVIVSRIFMLTRAANRGQWSELAADYRHLAEGLRTMAYLPATGSFRPPVLQLGPYATRATTQSAIERLLQSITRRAGPDLLLGVAGTGAIRQLDAASALAVIRARWIGGQIAYHAANADRMSRMSEWLAAVARISAAVVVAIVPIDLVLVFLHALKLTLPGFLDSATPYLLWATAILPAIIAGVNGLRSQSESVRLADRSEHLHDVLEKLAERIDRREAAEIAMAPAAAQVVDVVLIAEEMARLMLDEVTDWSALYSKELDEA